MPAFPNPLAEYIEQFSAIVDQLGAYHRTTDPLFYTMRFIDGLKDHIRAPVSLHAPQTGILLVSLQEDPSAPRKPEVCKWDVSSGAKPFTRTALPLPLPPACVDKPAAPVELKPAPNIGQAPSADERWAALRSLRRSQGPCFRCGSKWSWDHRCPHAVQLQVLEEVLGLFSLEESAEPSDAVVEESEPA